MVWDEPIEKYYNIVSQVVSSNYSIPTRFITSLGKIHGSSLNNRFRIYNEIQTDAVFAIDDDIRIRHDGVLGAFGHWKVHPDLIMSYSRQDVGYDTSKEAGYYYYKHTWPSNTNVSSTLGLTLKGGTMMHRQYYKLYTKEVDAMAYVDEVHNGEDILMNWVVAKDMRQRRSRRLQLMDNNNNINHENAVPVIPPGVAVFLYPYFSAFPDTPANEGDDRAPVRISHSGNHFQKRTECIQKFVEIFGFAIEGHNDWSVGWHPKCTLEMGTCDLPAFDGDEPWLNARTCVYSPGSHHKDVYI